MASDIWCSNYPRCMHRSASVRCKLVLVLMVLGTVASVHAESQGPSPDFDAHTLFRPRVYHGRTKRRISTSKENELDHAEVLTVGFEIDGVERILDLRLNTDLIPRGYQQRHQHRGTYVVETPSKVELCHYQGSVRDVPGSWVALSTCKGLRGVVFDGENLHHIHPQDDSLESEHYLYKHRDLSANKTCGYEGTPHQVLDRDHRGIHRIRRSKRAAEVIRGPYNANRQSRYVELVLVIDKKEFMALENSYNVFHHCKDIANIINALYMPLNIFIALVGVQVWTETDEITLSSNGDVTLSNFLRYRREKLVQDMPNDNAQLLTRIQFEGGVVGKALKGPICTYEFSGGVSMDHSNVVGLVAATVAHEMGHNFGMEHDSADCECPEEKCIMASSSGSSGPIHWSTCSLEHLALAFEHGMDYCLRNKPRKLFDSPMCGNGFVEPGEQCDCGLEKNCDNPCCNATTCMLYGNASCATGACCDLKTCRPKSAGTECRSAEHECDLPEYCTGQSEYCPADVFKMDGEVCSMGKAFCYQGTCRTHNDQCKLLWGPTGTTSDDQCYEMNERGTKNGNCGYNRVESSYVKCTNENLRCGMLHCKHLNERLEFGMESVAILSHSFINNGGKIIPCRSAIVDLGLNQVDPGLAPDGAKCAPGKMCVNQKCMAVAELRASVSGGKACPNNCSGNGVCNSLGHCHCIRGFRPPDCTQPGVGGSDDSGPAQDPNAKNEFVTAIYIILGVLPMVALSSFGVWYVRNSGQHWKKGALSTTDRGHNRLSIKTIDRSSPLPRSIETIDSSISQDPACASLLPKADADERYNNNLFGQFKGFTITPLHNQGKPAAEATKPAPPLPTIHTVAIKTHLKVLQKSASAFRTAPSPATTSLIQEANESTVPPALPPLNPGCTSRPLISSPVLSATTCTSVELVPPKPTPRPTGEIPVRPAPAPPTNNLSSTLQRPPRPSSTPLINISVAEPDRKNEKGSTLNRIASILRPNSGIVKPNVQSQSIQKDEKNTNSLPRFQHHKANKVIDKEILRNLEISNPIPQKEIEIPAATIPVISVAEAEKRNVVLRAQSMRDTKQTSRPAIFTFGSMRQTTPVKRPTSIPASARPTSPPPGPPTNVQPQDPGSEHGIKIPGLPGYQNPPVRGVLPKSADSAYDDCMNLISEQSLTKIAEESPSNDNIYAVIEEAVPEKNRKNVDLKRQHENEYKSPKRIEVNAVESMGLLSEIVSEISNRNFDSIYSTSTLADKSQAIDEVTKNADALGSNGSLGTYVNSVHYKTPGSLYSNSISGKFNSSSSTTSSGYLNPSALNVPQAEKNAPDRMTSGVRNNNVKQVEVNKVASPSSDKSNGNGEVSHGFAPKSPESSAAYCKPFASAASQSSALSPTKEERKDERGKSVAGNRMKLISNYMKSTSRNSGPDTNAKSGRQGFAVAKSKSPPESGPASPRKESDPSVESREQCYDALTDVKQIPIPSSKSINSVQKADCDLQRQEMHTDVSTVCLKSVPYSSKDTLENLNSPDVVSSCSTTNQCNTKSPDVLGNNAKCIVGSKNSHKPPVLSKVSKPSHMSVPPKPSSVASKATGLIEKKKSPTSTVTITKSLPSSAKETGAKISQKFPNKLELKNDSGVKANPIPKPANAKSNVASLQQKFENNRNSVASRTTSSVHKKTAGK